jgi:hypothetical protein
MVLKSGCLMKGQGIVQANGKQKSEKENVPENKPLIQRQHERPLRAFPPDIILRLPRDEAKLRSAGKPALVHW